MKKFLTSIIAAGIIAALTSCGESDRNNYSLSQISNPTDADSLMYYYGQLRAIKFWKDVANDSILNTKEAQKEYLEGMRDAMKALDRSDAYLMGLIEGANNAANISDYSHSYARKFNPQVMMKSMMAALNNDSVEDLMVIRRNFYNLRNRLEQDRDSRDEIKATEALIVTAKQLGMTRVTNDLWKKVLIEGAGDKVERGDRAELAIQLSTIDGQKVPLHFPSQIVVGGRLVSTVFPDAFLTMKYGQTAEFATTALAVFGSHSEQMGLKPETVLILHVNFIGELNADDPNVIDDGSTGILFEDRTNNKDVQ